MHVVCITARNFLENSAKSLQYSARSWKLLNYLLSTTRATSFQLLAEYWRLWEEFSRKFLTVMQTSCIWIINYIMMSLRPKNCNRPFWRPSTPLVKYSDTVTPCSGPRSTRPRAQIAGTPPGTSGNLGKVSQKYDIYTINNALTI